MALNPFRPEKPVEPIISRGAPSGNGSTDAIPELRHDPISPSRTAPNPIGVGTHPLSTPPGLRDVPGGPFDPSTADKR
ncbi:MAG: hypothetical protein WCE63_23280 [Acidobacteriaceae bacterium]